MYHRVRRKMRYSLISAILLLSSTSLAFPKSTDSEKSVISKNIEDDVDNNIIDFDDVFSVKLNKKYGTNQWGIDNFNKESHRYTVLKDDLDIAVRSLDDDKFETKIKLNIENETNTKNKKNATRPIFDSTATPDYSVIPLELVSTTENVLISILESTTEPDLTVIPLSTTQKVMPKVAIKQTIELPSSTQASDSFSEDDVITTETEATTTEFTTEKEETTDENNTEISKIKLIQVTSTEDSSESYTTEEFDFTTKNETDDTTTEGSFQPSTDEELQTNTTDLIETINRTGVSSESNEDVPIFTELDIEDQSEVPEDYYDSKDVVPTKAPTTDALSVIFGLAGSVVESVVGSVAERVVPKGIFDLFKRMQRQSEALESERLRSREENGGLGQFGRGILKSISSGLSKPLSQLMAGVRDFGSLDNDRGFVGSLASGVTSVANVANSLVDTFKDRVQAIYPGTVWCGDGRSAAARSSDLGLFFFTDTCCRQHDACKLFIRSGDTKYGLTNTGLFTRSHCSCDTKFRECLRKTSSLVSAQIGLTYFNVLGPQCFRRAHPIVRCIRKTRITGLKCEEYELDYSKPKMWQWFDNETF